MPKYCSRSVHCMKLIWNLTLLFSSTSFGNKNFNLEGCIDDERQFKTVKRPQAPGDATVRKRFFRDNFVIVRRKSKRIAFLESVNFSTCAYMQLYNYNDGHMTTFRHPSGAYISQMPGHRLAKSTPSESRLSIGTIGLG